MFRSFLLLAGSLGLAQAHAAPQAWYAPIGETIKTDGASGANCLTVQTKDSWLPQPILNAVISIETGREVQKPKRKYLVARVYLEKGLRSISSIKIPPVLIPKLKTASVEEFRNICGVKIYFSRQLGNLLEFSWPVDDSIANVKLVHFVMGPDDLDIPGFVKLVQKYKDKFRTDGVAITSYQVQGFRWCSGDDFEDCLSFHVPKFRDAPPEELYDRIESVDTVDMNETFVHKLQSEAK